MDEQPDILGCSLSTTEVEDRRKARQAVAAALVDGERNDSGFRVRFRAEPGLSEVLRALVAAERDCCAWGRWEVTDEGDCSVLEVTGPPGRIGTLASAFGI